MSNIQINISDNGTTTLATAGKYCDRNVDVVVDVQGGGGGDLPPEAFNITGVKSSYGNNDCSYLNYNGLFDWFFDTYGDNITITVDKNTSWMDGSKITEWNMNLNIGGGNENYLFGGMRLLEHISDNIEVTVKSDRTVSLMGMFNNCFSLRNIPESLYVVFQNSFKNTAASCFSSCYSIREIPQEIMPHLNQNIVSNIFVSACSLDEVNNFPVHGTYSANSFAGAFNSMYRLKSFTFVTNNGIPYVAEWKTHTLDFSNRVGWAYNGGTAAKPNFPMVEYGDITIDSWVKDDETYQALKNSPDWFTDNENYSRYNHDSAVETINSLPDTSAYLATAGGTNTIKFRGVAGSLTDGGAINTLTAEEIAVATAKGWTVTLV